MKKLTVKIKISEESPSLDNTFLEGQLMGLGVGGAADHQACQASYVFYNQKCLEEGKKILTKLGRVFTVN